MPQLSLADALRYFFAPFVLYSYYFFLLPEQAGELAKDLGALGSISALVSGSVLYYVYRYFVYDVIILPLYDRLRTENHRIFLMRRHPCIHSTRLATRVVQQMTDDEAVREALEIRNRPIRAAGIHLLYQGSLYAIPFVVYGLSLGSYCRATILVATSAVLLATAIRMDNAYEDEMLMVVKAHLDKADGAAKLLGLSK